MCGSGCGGGGEIGADVCGFGSTLFLFCVASAYPPLNMLGSIFSP